MTTTTVEWIRELVKQSLQHTEVKDDDDLGEQSLTRKHFQMVADLIKREPDAKKRKELGLHHSAIFKAANPRFDHARFMKAANAE